CEAKLNGMCETTRSGTWSAPSALGATVRYAIAPSCQSTVPSSLASGVTTTVARGSSSVVGEPCARYVHAPDHTPTRTPPSAAKAWRWSRLPSFAALPDASSYTLFVTIDAARPEVDTIAYAEPTGFAFVGVCAVTGANVSPTEPRSGLMTAVATFAPSSADATDSRSWPGISRLATRNAAVSSMPVTSNVTVRPSTVSDASIVTPSRSGNVRR